MAFFHPSLREDPFNPEDSARYFYLADQYREALDLLVRHVLRRGGLSHHLRRRRHGQEQPAGRLPPARCAPATYSSSMSSARSSIPRR